MRTTQTRKRSRSSNYGYQSKRRRIFRRARRAVDKTSTNFTKPQSRNWNRRLTRRKIRAYKRSLWIVSNVMQKWRIAYTSSEAFSTPATLTTYHSRVYPVLKSPIDLTDPANFVSDDGGQTVTATGDVVILRGGIWTMTLAHENAENIDYKIYLVKMKNYAAANGEINKAASPIFGDENKEEVKLLKTWEGTLAPSTSMKLTHKMGIQKMDKYFQTTNKMQHAFLVCAGNTVTASAVAVSCTLSVNAWVCADVITP